MNIEQGIYLTTFLNPLKPPLLEWFKVQKEYLDTVLNDAPYIYTERSNTGLLASAFYRCNWIALEEYNAFKKDKEKGIYKGRADLYIASQKFERVIEFKQIFLSLTRGFTQSSLGQIKHAYQLGKTSAIQSKAEGHKALIGIFNIPYLKQINKGIFENDIKSSITSLKENFKPDALAWWFPEDKRNWKLYERQEKPYYPGVILMLRRPWVKQEEK